MVVRKPAPWMTQTDERILEILSTDGLHTPSHINEDDRLSVSRAHCNVRLTKLEDANLVENVGNGVYRIAADGEDFLTGEIAVS